MTAQVIYYTLLRQVLSQYCDGAHFLVLPQYPQQCEVLIPLAHTHTRTYTTSVLVAHN